MIGITAKQMDVVEAICASNFCRSEDIARLIGASRGVVDTRLQRMAKAMGMTCTAPSKVIGIVRGMGVNAFVVVVDTVADDDGPPFPEVLPTAAWLAGPDFSAHNLTIRYR